MKVQAKSLCELVSSSILYLSICRRLQYYRGLYFTRSCSKGISKSKYVFLATTASFPAIHLQKTRLKRKVGPRGRVRHRGAEAGLVCPTMFVSSFPRGSASAVACPRCWNQLRTEHLNLPDRPEYKAALLVLLGMWQSGYISDFCTSKEYFTSETLINHAKYIEASH